MIILLITINLIVCAFWILLNFSINAYPFNFTRNPEEHVNRYKEDLTLFRKENVNYKKIYFEFNNTEKEPKENLKAIIVQYNKFFGIYYLSKYFYFSDNLVIYNSGIYRKRINFNRVNNDTWRRNL